MTLFLTQEQIIHQYLEDSERIRNRYGLTKMKGRYWICDLAMIEKLDPDLKLILRNWISQKKKDGLYGGVIKED